VRSANGDAALDSGLLPTLQVVKLACSFAVSTPYYLITDSDMFFLHPVGALDLMDQEECRPDSGVCDAKKAIAFRALNEMQPPVAKGDAQAQWISNSAATLNVRRPAAHLLAFGRRRLKPGVYVHMIMVRRRCLFVTG